MSEDRLVEFGAMLEQYTEELRRRELLAPKTGRVVLQCAIDERASATYDVQVDKSASAEEIGEQLRPVDQAFERLRVRAKIATLIADATSKADVVDRALKKLAERQREFGELNTLRSEGRRQEVGLQPQQLDDLKQSRDAVDRTNRELSDILRDIDEHKRVLAGEDLLEIASERLARRLDLMQIGPERAA